MLLGFLYGMAEKSRTRGRPRAYDPDVALDRAVELFWANGLQGTSLDDLGAAMGMGRPSIYNAFGDKEQLFLKALARYRDTVGSTPLRAMESIDQIGSALDAFFSQIVNYATEDSSHLGCLFGSVAIATSTESVQAFLRDNLEWLQTQLAARLQAAVETEQLPPSFPVETGARRAVDELLSIAVRARMGLPRDELMAAVHDATLSVLAA